MATATLDAPTNATTTRQSGKTIQVEISARQLRTSRPAPRSLPSLSPQHEHHLLLGRSRSIRSPPTVPHHAVTYDSMPGGDLRQLRHADQRQSAHGLLRAGGQIAGRNPDQPIRLAPLSKFPVVRDLSVDRSVLFENLKAVSAWVPIDGTYDLGPGGRQAHKFRNSAIRSPTALAAAAAWRSARSSRLYQLRRCGHHRQVNSSTWTRGLGAQG